MPSIDAVVECPLHDSFRVQQVAGMFDVPLEEKLRQRFQVDVPDLDEPWQIGLVVGPSGSGKSSVARQAFGGSLYRAARWPDDRAIVDAFGDLPVRQVVDLLTAVGFSSPPSWVKPYQVLSGGERFRCDLARALSEGLATRQSDAQPPLVVFDEFTSVVDRNVARACSAAVAKAVRLGRVACRFVAVTCHYDVARWLEPDWVLDMATGELCRRRLRRPSVELQIRRCPLAAWQLFKRHHYLSGSLAPQARCYLATWQGVPVHFAATIPVLAKRNHRRFTRIVTLPDYQGLGIGMRAVAAVAQLHRSEGLRVNVTSSHPALVGHCRRSPLWRAVDVKPYGSRRATGPRGRRYQGSTGRAVVSFEYVGPARYEP